MLGEGKIHPSNLGTHLRRYLKCNDIPEHNRQQTHSHLLKQLFLLRPDEEYNKESSELMGFLSSLGPRQICQYQFKANDIVWMCKDCQRDETCVICNECYQASDHEGHDVYFYHSTSGGCCDCGDAEAWNSKGCCDKHGRVTSDPMSFIPREIARASVLVFDTIAECLLDYANYISTLYEVLAPRRMKAGAVCTTVLVLDEYHTAEEFSALLNLAEDPVSLTTFANTGCAQLRSGDFEDCRTLANELQLRGFNAMVGYISDKAKDERMVAAVSFLHQLALSNDGMCGFICSVLDDDLLTRILALHPLLPKELAKTIFDLLLVLMAVQSFKIVIAVAYTRAYPKIARLYGKGLSQSTTSAFALSVQFLNREVFVNDVCFAHDFLKVNISAINALLCHAKAMTADSEDTHSEVSADMTRALKHNILVKRRYCTIVGDLKVIFTIPRISRYFLSDNLDGFLDMMESYQYLHPQERALYLHVEYEDQDWMAAFNLNLGITGMFDNLFNWFKHTDASCTIRVKYLGYEAHPDSFEVLSCVEDGWMPSDDANANADGGDAVAATHSKGFGHSFRKAMSRFFNTTGSAKSSPSPISPTTAGAGGEKGKSPPTGEGHLLTSVWRVLQKCSLRCFAWEKRFRATHGIGVTLPPRERGNNKYAQYGDNCGEDVQLIDLIQEFAQLGIGRLPRLLSFHLPLHRTLACAIQECCRHAHLVVCLRSLQGFMSEQAVCGNVPINGTIDIPLFTMIMASQINLHMWQRNGQAMSDQVINYDSYPFYRIYKELDTLLIQFLLTVHPTDQFVSQLFYRFGVAEYLAHRKCEATGVSSNDSSHLPALLDESLKFLVNLVTELPVPFIAASPPCAKMSAAEARLLPIIRREFLHKLVGGPTTYLQLQECLSVNPECSHVNTELIDGLVEEIAVRTESMLGPPTYTLKKELWAEYDPCFPRVAAAVHQKAFEDRPKVTVTAPIITKPFEAHECFAAVRDTLLLAPVLLRVQRDLLFVAASERCPKNKSYQTVRDKWTLKCSDSVYGKVLQLLTLAVYVTQDLSAAISAADADGTPAIDSVVINDTNTAATATASALEAFVREECFLPNSADALTVHMFAADAVPGTKMPSLLHVLMDIYYANDPLDINSKHWVLWLIDQITSLSPECASVAAKYRTDHAIGVTGNGHPATDLSGTPSKSPTLGSGGGDGGAGSETKAMSARDKAMQAMKDKAAQFMMMMEGMSSDEEDEDDDDYGGDSKNKIDLNKPTEEKEEDDAAPERQGVKSAGNVVTAEMRGEDKSKNSNQMNSSAGVKSSAALRVGAGADAGAGGVMEVVGPGDGKTSTLSTGTTTNAPTSTDSEDSVPLCIICQTDANAEDSSGNMRTLGFLALVQASTVLNHDCLDCTRNLRVVSGLSPIHASVAPKPLSSEGNTHISFCGHGMHQDCFDTYLRTELRKAGEQRDMLLDANKLQFCCPLCKKLGNVFMPYVETDPARMEARELIKMKLAAALKKKQIQLIESSEVVNANSNVSASISEGLEEAPATGGAGAETAASSKSTAKTLVVRPDATGMPPSLINLLPSPAQKIKQLLSSTTTTAPAAASVSHKTEQIWCWGAWMKHPSMINCDLAAYMRYSSSPSSAVGISLVSFGDIGDDHDAGGIKRARSQTNDSSDFGRMLSKVNTSSHTPEFPSPMDTAAAASDGGGVDREDNLSETEMSYTLNDIDLNSSSTERVANATAALESDLDGISVDGTGGEREGRGNSFDFGEDYESDSEEYRFLLELSGADDGRVVDPVKELDRANRRKQRILDTLRNHARDDIVTDCFRRMTWAKFLEDCVSTYSDGSKLSSATHSAKALALAPTDFSGIAQSLQLALRMVAYSISCDVAEHNIPGYHLLAEKDLYELSGPPISGEKSTVSSASTSAAAAATATAESYNNITNSPAVMYVKKYSIGMDEYRYLEKTVDALACTLRAFGGLDVSNRTLLRMISGSTQDCQSSLRVNIGVKSAEVNTGSYDWMFSPQNSSPGTVPLLAAPMLDVLVLSIVTAKAAPAGYKTKTPTSASNSSNMLTSPTRGVGKSPFYGVQFNPLWNIEHAVRVLCFAKLVQLLTIEVGKAAGGGGVEEDERLSAKAAFDPYPSVAGLVHAILSSAAFLNATKPAASTKPAENHWNASSVQHMLFQWVAFMRTAAHLLYRTTSALVVAGPSAENAVLPHPSDWVKCKSSDFVPVLLQEATELSDAQIYRHICMLSMANVMTNSSDSLVESATRWLVDLSKWNSTQQQQQHKLNVSADSLDIGVSTQSEIETVAVTAAAGAGEEVLPVLKISSSVPTSSGNVLLQQQQPQQQQQQCVVPAQLLSAVYTCYPRLSRPRLLTLPREYTKLHAQVMSKIAAFRSSQPVDAQNPAAEGKVPEFDHPALCLVCATVLDAGGRGQCAAHTMACGGETGVYFLLQECQVLINQGPRGVYYASPYIDCYGESQHSFRGKPLYLDNRRYESLNHLWATHQIPREVVSKRSNATRIIINNYY